MLSPAETATTPICHFYLLRRCLFYFLALLLMTPGAGAVDVAVAQIPRIDAGQSLRDIEIGRPTIQQVEEPQMQMPQGQQPESDSEDADPALKQRIRVSRYQISGNTLFSGEELLAVLKPWQERELTLAQLRQVAYLLSQYYQQRGYLYTYSYLPPQEIEEGVVQIAIREAHYGQIMLYNNSAVNATLIAGLLRHIQTGKPIQQEELHRALLQLNDLPGLQVKSALQPGGTSGTSDLLIQADTTERILGSLSLENYGGTTPVVIA